MSNSELVSYIDLSPNYTPMTNKVNRKITIHHMAGNLSVETCGRVFGGTREASSNYGIGSDGRIAMYVEEKNRAWTSSSRSNDSQAVTIEVANNSGDPDWTVSDAAMSSLIKLCVDICKRNHIEKLVYTGDSSGNLTRHNMFAATLCPGPYLQERFPWIAEQVNAQLKMEKPAKPDPRPETTDVFEEGDRVKIKQGAKYATGQSIPAWVYEEKMYLRELWTDDRAVVSTVPSGPVTGVVYTRDLVNLTEHSFKSFLVKVTADVLNYREGPSTDYPVNGQITNHGVYTIVDQKGDWGKLKSGAGWIYLGYTKKI